MKLQIETADLEDIRDTCERAASQNGMVFR